MIVSEQALSSTPLHAENFEFVELCNTGLTPLNLSGLALHNNPVPNTLLFQFPLSARICPGDCFVVVASPAAFRIRYGASIPVIGSFVSSQKLNNGGERLWIEDSTGQVPFFVSYLSASPWPTAPKCTGPSLVLATPETSPSNPSSALWKVSHGDLDDMK